jgi:hypothetical protein
MVSYVLHLIHVNYALKNNKILVAVNAAKIIRKDINTLK